MPKSSKRFSVRFPIEMKTQFLVSCLIAMLLSSSAWADEPELWVRQLSNGTYEAVLSLNSFICVQVNAASSVQVDAFEILIESPTTEQFPCVHRPPIVYYELTAAIGELVPGNYTVTWNQPGNFSWSTTFLVKGPAAIPSSSIWSLALLILGLLVLTPRAFRFQ